MLVLAFLNAVGLTLAISWSKIFDGFRWWAKVKGSVMTVDMSNNDIKKDDWVVKKATEHWEDNVHSMQVKEIIDTVDGTMLKFDKFWKDPIGEYMSRECLVRPKKIWRILLSLTTCTFCLGFHITNLMLVLHWVDPMVMYWLGGLTGSTVTYAIYQKFFAR